MCFSPGGALLAQRYLGVLGRNHEVALDLDDLLGGDALAEGGHGELVYDFREGGDANGWLHALFRYEQRGERACRRRVVSARICSIR